MPFINAVATWFFKKRFAQIAHFMQEPVQVQHELMLKLVRQAEDTEYGQLYNFDKIHDYDSFARSMPLQHYDDIKPYIDRNMLGQQNILWPTDIKWYAKSSGTTGQKSKFIPLSNESLEECHFKASKDVLSIFCQNYPNTTIFDGKGLIMGGSHKVSEINNSAYFGDLSAILLQNYPFWLDFLRTPGISLALLEDWEEKLEKIARATIHENVTSISGVPSWNLILLKRIIEISGKNHIIDVWPNLQLFIHGGVSFIPYRHQFEKIIGSDAMVYLETYNASEGFFGIQDQPGKSEMLLMLDYGVFYEFIPMDTFDDPNPTVLPLEAVETGTNYAIVITTNGGLWRYIIGDTVSFISLSPYRILISGRTKNYINAFGEEIVVGNTDKALDFACRETGAIISEYTASPIFLDDDNRAAHEYLIEFEKEPAKLHQFVEALDSELKNLNSDYEAKRTHDLILQKPQLVVAPRNTFFNWMKSKGRIGGQNKVPRLYNDRRYMDEILAFIKNTGE